MLVPTIAYLFLNRRGGGNNRNINILDVGEGEWDDESDSDHDDVPLVNGVNLSASWGLMDAPYKMVLCVNTSLGMGKGKCILVRVDVYLTDLLLKKLRDEDVCCVDGYLLLVHSVASGSITIAIKPIGGYETLYLAPTT